MKATLIYCIPAVILVLAASALSGTFNYRLVPSRKFLAPADTTLYPISLTHPEPAFLACNADSIKRELYINFEKKEVELVVYYSDRLASDAISAEDSVISGVVLNSYVFLELDEYLAYINSQQLADDWKINNPFYNMTEEKRKAFNILDIQIPVKLPAWARRVVGSEGPRLTISGMFKITVGGSSHWIEGSENIDNQSEGFPDIHVGQEMNFTVTGKIGRLINVQITTDNTQEITDQLKKQMKIHYKGETEEELEDEIIQEIEAGYTNFSMPGAEFDGYSESHEGLFGIKMRMKLGDLSLTTIISQEDGQADKKTFNPSQEKTMTSLEDRDIVYDRAFFLHKDFYDHYYAAYFKSPKLDVPKIKAVYLFKLDPYLNYNTWQSDRAAYPEHQRIGIGLHRRLREQSTEKGGIEFYLDKVNGYVVLYNALSSEQDQLIAYFETEDGKNSFRDYGLKYTLQNDTAIIESATVEGKVIYPYVLRPQNHSNNDSATWILSWKNIYELGEISEQNRNSVEIKVKHQDSVTQQWHDNAKIGNKDTLLSDFFGLTVNGNPATDNPRIFKFNQGLLAFPQSFGPEPFNSTELPDNLRNNKDVYQYERDQHSQKAVPNLYRIEITAKSARTSFSLGVINILEGSEKVKIGSKELVKNKDYLIQYDIGQITLISDEAINSMDNINIEFEYAPFFIPEEKRFMGVRAEYKLPGVGKDSYVAASFLRKSETSQDKRAQLGREPTTNMIVDVNTKLSWEPDWMTELTNRVPLVKTQEKSNITFSAEYARSIVDPNTNERDEALVDDFEDAKTMFALQMSDALWNWASQPVAQIIGPYAPMQCWGGNGRNVGTTLEQAGWFAWYTRDTTQVSIWAGSANRQARWRILEMQMHPHRKSEVQDKDEAGEWFRKASWGGTMTTFGYGVTSQLESAQYLELWVHVFSPSNDRGIMHVDIGKISEDLRIAIQPGQDRADTTDTMIVNSEPDQEFNTEWWDPNRKYISKETDLGLDMRPDFLEGFMLPVETGDSVLKFDTVYYDAKDVPDPAGDNFDWTVQNQNFRTFNGTQGNGSGEHFDTRKQRDPDDEDVFNSNGLVDFNNSYYHYWIDLNVETPGPAEPYLAEALSNGWRLYKIPLLQRKTVGDLALDNIPFQINDPILTKATGMRIWFNNMIDSTIIQIAKMEIVGNKWVSLDTARMAIIDSVTDTTRHDTIDFGKKINVSVVNTVENRESYRHPHFVPKYYDRDRMVEVREQSLYLDFDSLSSISGEVKAVKYYQRGLDFRLYKQMVLYYMMVEKKRRGIEDRSDNVLFFFKFGTDSSNYYEYHCFPDVYGSWDSIKLDLNEIALLKLSEIEKMGKEQRRIEISEGNLRVSGYPTFADIKWMALGFRVDPGRVINPDDVFSGKIYVNDLKLTQPQDLSGNAARVNLSTKFADLLDISSAAYYKDGSFLKLTEKREGGGESEMSMDVNSTLQLSKFTPAKWGLSLPLTASLRSTVRRPRFVPSSDVQLSDDGIGEIGPDLFNLMASRDLMTPQETRARRYETTTATKTVSSSYSKNTSSDNIFVNLLADRVKTAGGYSVADNKNVTEISRNNNVNNNVNYDASARNDRAYSPFKNAQKTFSKEHFADMKLFYYPRSLNFKVYDARYSKVDKWTRPTLDSKRKLPTSYTLSMGHSYDLNLPFIEWRHLNMGLSHSNSVDRNFNEIVTEKKGVKSGVIGDHILSWDSDWLLIDGFGPLSRRYILEGETGNNQSFSYYLEPSVVQWLRHDFDYRANYGHSLNNQVFDTTKVDYLNQNASRAFSTNINWMFVDMFDNIFGKFKKEGDESLFKPVKKWFDYFGFSKVGFNYNVDVSKNISNLRQVPLTPSQFMAFKAGFFGMNPRYIITGKENDTLFGGWEYHKTKESRNVYVKELGYSTSDIRKVNLGGSTNTGVKLPFLLNMNINTSLRYSRRYSETAGYMTVDTSITWPDISINGTISDFMPVFKRLPMLGNKLDRASVNSGFTWNKTTDIKFDRYDADIRWENLAYKYALNPLLRLSMDFKNRVRLSNDINWSLDRAFNTEENVDHKGTESYMISDKFSISYTIKKNKQLKLVFWELTLNNQLELFANYEYSVNTTYEWDVRLGDEVFETYGDHMDYKKMDEPVHKEKKKVKNFTTGFNYNITSKMKAGADFTWKKSLDILPEKEEDDEDNRREYNINVQVWVQWNF